jgi:hypothetical protein
MEGAVTVTLTAGVPFSRVSILKSPRARAALRQAIYAPIDEHRTGASNGDIAAAWIAAGLIALALLVALPF